MSISSKIYWFFEQKNFQIIFFFFRLFLIFFFIRFLVWKQNVCLQDLIDPDPGSQNVEDPKNLDPDSKHWVHLV